MSSKNDLDPNQPAPAPAGRGALLALATMLLDRFPDATPREIARAVMFVLPDTSLDDVEAVSAELRKEMLRWRSPVRPITSD